MASLKSLMKAKKESSRLSHPHARYSSSGQLSCSLCGTQLKNEAIWGSHLVSKQHRVNVQKAEREQLQRQEQQVAASSATNGKRKSRSPSPSASSSKRPRESSPPAPPPSNNLPSDFYSAPSREPIPSTSTAPIVEEVEEDPSIDEFLSTLSAEPSTTTSAANSASATISAAPVKFEFGAPKVRADGEEGNDEEDGEEEEQGETEEERKEREEREEREEMMARLEEEEREQREADEKVTALKRRLELMRQAKKSKKP
ncbi:C2H2-type zinc finger protein [Sporobolomyces salmoneus]|uniref:C2H2-type zinc finger protein n=1 Tax=Sporobolomyces salmoneus TaxID=183962 RepID=UPI00316E1156